MRRVDEYRIALRSLAGSLEPYLSEHSGLLGPRGNLELVQAVADESPAVLLRSYDQHEDEFFAACGTVGLGRLLAEVDASAEAELHQLAGDPRWRVREAVAMPLQRLGDADEDRMLDIVEHWATDPSPLVLRAGIAGACEPRLLTRPESVRRVLDVLDLTTQALASCSPVRARSESFRVLRQALAYCWSVAVAARPQPGFERWTSSENRDVRWMLRKNLTKARMQHADPDRCRDMERRLAA